MIIAIPTNMDLMACRAASVAQFMKDLHKLMGVTANISTAYHPQTDGQMEHVNQEIKQYL